ncbi:MAG TPA: hypothetical protein VIY29_09895, partial [Ktedonobacteraceae bacterium]
MVGEILCTGPAGSLPELVKQCGFSTEAFLLVERLPQQVVPDDDDERQNLLYFAHLRAIQQEDIARYTSYTTGRIFDQESELRWEYDAASGTTSAVYLGKPCTLAGLKEDEKDKEELASLKPAANNPKYYYLFGTSLAEQDLEQ